MSNRLEKNINGLKPANVAALPPKDLRAARALQVLIYLNTPASRKLLEDISQGPLDQFPTRQAKVALQRFATGTEP